MIRPAATATATAIAAVVAASFLVVVVVASSSSSAAASAVVSPSAACFAVPPSRRRGTRAAPTASSAAPPAPSALRASAAPPTADGETEDADGGELAPPPPPSSSVAERCEEWLVDVRREEKDAGRTFRGRTPRRRRARLSCCNREECSPAIREKVVGEHRNRMEFMGPATGQLVYGWEAEGLEEAEARLRRRRAEEVGPPPSVLLLVKRDDPDLEAHAAGAVRELTSNGVRVLLDPELAAKMKYYHGVDDDGEYIALFEGEGGGRSSGGIDDHDDDDDDGGPDLICTLGGDGLLMHASSLFPGPVPPILCVAGGSMGFLTPFSREEMVDAIRISLGLYDEDYEQDLRADSPPAGIAAAVGDANGVLSRETRTETLRLGKFHRNRICLSMRMRLDCRILNREGVVRARFSVLNEVVIDRGSSPYLAALECYCDDVHLTTVQADGVIFSTPTGSTAYSMAAGGSVVHPAVPAILVTPICPHVLSFRPMILPDHVVLRCYVPDDARSDACVAFDGKHRRELRRGDSVRISMSAYPVPTINRMDHSSDWLNSLKSNFNFNTRVRQNPL